MPTTPHPITKEKVPLTMGHEFSGTVEEVGEDIHDLKVGSRVVVQPIIYDGTCNACKEGLINCCDNNGFVGLSGRTSRNLENRKFYLCICSGWGGGLSEHVVIPRKAVYEIPDNISMEVGGESLNHSIPADDPLTLEVSPRRAISCGMARRENQSFQKRRFSPNSRRRPNRTRSTPDTRSQRC